MIDEKKLIYLNNYYINNSPEESIFNTLIELKGSDLKNLNITDEMILKFISLYKKRSSSILEINEKIFQIFHKKYNFTKDQIEILNSLKNNKSLLIEEFSSIVDWNEYIIDEKIKYILNKLDLKFKQLGQPLRLILSGSSDGPSVSKLMEIIGKDQSLEKLQHNW